MKLAKLFKKSTAPEGLELNAVLDAILRLEIKADAAKQAVERAQQDLQDAQAEALDSTEDADLSQQANAVVAEKSKLEGFEALLKQAKSKAVGIIAGGSAGQRQRLAEVEADIDKTKNNINARRVKAVAEFAKKHNFRVDWPSKDNSGVIHLPSLSFDGAEVERIAAPVVVALHRDPDDEKLEQLQAERQRLNVVIGSTPDLALDTLLAERRRK